jgi:hypothetical protein
MRRHGVIVPVLVRQNGSPETFEIVAGAAASMPPDSLPTNAAPPGRRSTHALRHP